MKSFLGKCSGCGHHLQVSAEVAEETEPTYHGRTGKLITPRRRSWRVVWGKHDGLVTRMESAWNGKWQIGFACPHCSAQMGVSAVAGHVTKAVCNDKCMASTSGKCECACGGRNHGKSYAA